MDNNQTDPRNQQTEGGSNQQPSQDGNKQDVAKQQPFASTENNEGPQPDHQQSPEAAATPRKDINDVPDKEEREAEPTHPNRNDINDVPETDAPEIETIEDEPVVEPTSATRGTVKTE